MVETPRLQAKRRVWAYGRAPTYRLGAHTTCDLQVHVIWIPKYRKPLLVGPVAIRVRDLIRQIAIEHEL
ncbi:transposase [Candidatus Methylomirabilis sp.]|uniref:transposase n=1 Tax=Candidatus Methylomirabilis sp. TaxID=2032687 RepID=UPI002A62C404|nr:transposase [Candidatus Methylomirabilis sp.]